MRLVLIAVAILASALAMFVVLTRPVELTMPVYATLANAFETAPVRTSFEPVGYPWLLSLVPGPSVSRAVKLLHLTCFLGVVWGTLWMALRTAKVTRTAFGAGLVILTTAGFLLNPYALINLIRLNDNGVNVLFAMIAFALIDDDAVDAVGTRLWIAAAVVGAWMFVRPNVLSLLPLIVVLALRATRASRAAMALKVAVAVVAAYVACSFVATGTPLFRPTNGPYNLLAGNNPFALEALGRDYNAEPSLPAAFDRCGMTAPLREAEPRAYLSCAAAFVTADPIGAIQVTGYKTYNLLFRPNLRLATSAGRVALQFASLLLTGMWWAIVIIALVRRQAVDRMAIAFVILFTLPFAVTNSDPRFRLPLDSVYALSLMRMVRLSEEPA